MAASAYKPGSLFEGEDEADQSPFEAAVLYEPGETRAGEEDDLSDLDLSFDDDAEAKTKAVAAQLPAVSYARFFAQIPGEIVPQRRLSLRRLGLAIVGGILLALNAWSYFTLLR